MFPHFENIKNKQKTLVAVKGGVSTESSQCFEDKARPKRGTIPQTKFH